MEQGRGWGGGDIKNMARSYGLLGWSYRYFSNGILITYIKPRQHEVFPVICIRTS